MDDLSRRRLLGAVGATGAAVGTAGCSGLLGGNSNVQIAGLLAEIDFEETHAIRVEVDRNGERVFEETFELAGDDEYVVREASWPTDPATYTVYTALFGPEADGDIIKHEIDSPNENFDCHALTVHVNEDLPPLTDVQADPAENWDLSCE